MGIRSVNGFNNPGLPWARRQGLRPSLPDYRESVLESLGFQLGEQGIVDLKDRLIAVIGLDRALLLEANVVPYIAGFRRVLRVREDDLDAGD